MSLDPAVRSRSEPSVKVTAKKQQPVHHEIAHHTKVGNCNLLAHLSRRLIGELIVYAGIRRPLSVNIFKRLLL